MMLKLIRIVKTDVQAALLYVLYGTIMLNDVTNCMTRGIR